MGGLRTCGRSSGARSGGTHHHAVQPADSASACSSAADSPERNDLFQTLLQFDEKYHDEIRDLSTWQKFCRFASESFSMSGGG